MQAAEVIFLSRVLEIEAFGHLGVAQSRENYFSSSKGVLDMQWRSRGRPKYTLERLYPQAGQLCIYFSYFIFDWYNPRIQDK